MDAGFQRFVVLRAVAAGCADVDAAAESQEEPHKHGGKDGTGTNRTQCHGAGELADHSDICQIKQNLQHVGQHQRQTEQHDLFPQRTLGQILFL